MAKKIQTGPASKPNAGVEERYQRQLDALIDEMARSTAYWLKATWRRKTPSTIAEDASSVNELRKTLRGLMSRWQKQFDEAAPRMAREFALGAKSASEVNIRKILRDAGMTVKLIWTPQIRDAYQAVIGENVGLIKSIPQQFLGSVEGDVMRAVSMGMDLSTLTEKLQDAYGVTKRRAKNIARDQAAKANAAITKERHEQLGITHGIWRHSGASREPRESHVNMNGKEFELAKGAYLDGEWVLPGQAINCRCTWRPVIATLRKS